MTITFEFHQSIPEVARRDEVFGRLVNSMSPSYKERIAQITVEPGGPWGNPRSSAAPTEYSYVVRFFDAAKTEITPTWGMCITPTGEGGKLAFHQLSQM